MVSYFRSKNYDYMLEKRQEFGLYSADLEYNDLLEEVRRFYSYSQLTEINSLPEVFRVNIVIINMHEKVDGVEILTAGMEADYSTNYYFLRTENPDHFEIVYPVLTTPPEKGSPKIK